MQLVFLIPTAHCIVWALTTSFFCATSHLHNTPFPFITCLLNLIVLVEAEGITISTFLQARESQGQRAAFLLQCPFLMLLHKKGLQRVLLEHTYKEYMKLTVHGPVVLCACLVNLYYVPSTCQTHWLRCWLPRLQSACPELHPYA